MSDLPLNPLSLKLGLVFPRPTPMAQAQGVLAALFDEMAGIIAQNPGCVIGHIKGLAMFGREDWLKVNLIAAGRPAQTEASSDAPVQDMSLVVNFMVYGLEPDQLSHIAETAVNQPDKPWSGIARLAPRLPLAAVHDHEHDHRHDKDHT